MERHIFNKLHAWKHSPRRKPLILQGARQVGKTYALQQFAEKHYDNAVYVNFEEQPDMKGLFDGNLSPKRIIENLSIFYDCKISPQSTLMIFDEVQECPNALNSLKYFCEQANDYHITAAGSLLGVKLKQQKGFPVGKVNFCDMHPLTFEEFLLALDKERLLTVLQTMTLNQAIAEPIHHELLRLLKFYFFIGGMPEAVVQWLSSGQLKDVREVQKAIEKAYMLDFAKHAPASQVEKISQIWGLMPMQLAKENKKFIFSAVSKSARAREYEQAIQWLVDAGLVTVSYAVTAAKLPLKGYVNDRAFKLFLLDTGLLASMTNMPARAILEDNALFSEYHGAFTENYVAQVLTAKQFSLYYWKLANFEVDFLVEYEGLRYPLEVKAAYSKHKKSLQHYHEKYPQDPCARTSKRNVRRDDWLSNYPLYAIHRFPELQ